MATLTIELPDDLVSVLEEFCAEVKSNVPELLNRLAKDAASDTTAVLFNYYPECLSEDTWEALRESNEIARNPSAYKGYTDVDEMIRDILSESDGEDEDNVEVHSSLDCKIPA